MSRAVQRRERVGIVKYVIRDMFIPKGARL